jgi:hypothetical protein
MSKPEYSIGVLLPTRGRTDALGTSVKTLIELANNVDSIHLMLGFDNDDTIGVDYFITELKPWLDEHNVHYTAMSFEPMGYVRLNEYVNSLAKAADAEWLFFWNDDAIMETKGWDVEIAKYTGQFKLLAVHTHNDHPYSIFPIAPRAWLDTLGYLSPHQISDAWLSQQAYLLDIMKRIEVYVTHDRHDLTGNNADDTYKNRVMLEGNHLAPGDFNYETVRTLRVNDCIKLAKYMEANSIDTTFFRKVGAGEQDPWERMFENDPNKQVSLVAGVGATIPTEAFE